MCGTYQYRISGLEKQFCNTEGPECFDFSFLFMKLSFPLTFYNTFMSSSASCFLYKLAVILPPSSSKVLAQMLCKATVPSPKIAALCFLSFLYLPLQQPHLTLRCSSLFLSALYGGPSYPSTLLIKIEPVCFLLQSPNSVAL